MDEIKKQKKEYTKQLKEVSHLIIVTICKIFIKKKIEEKKTPATLMESIPSPPYLLVLVAGEEGPPLHQISLSAASTICVSRSPTRVRF